MRQESLRRNGTACSPRSTCVCRACKTTRRRHSTHAYPQMCTQDLPSWNAISARDACSVARYTRLVLSYLNNYRLVNDIRLASDSGFQASRLCRALLFTRAFLTFEKEAEERRATKWQSPFSKSTVLRVGSLTLLAIRFFSFFLFF